MLGLKFKAKLCLPLKPICFRIILIFKLIKYKKLIFTIFALFKMEIRKNGRLNMKFYLNLNLNLKRNVFKHKQKF